MTGLIKGKWTARQREVVKTYAETGGTQQEVAQLLGVNQPSVHKILASSNYFAYESAMQSVALVLSRIEPGHA